MDREDSPDSSHFAEIVKKLRFNDSSGLDDLRTAFDAGLRVLLARRGVTTDVERALQEISARTAERVRLHAPVHPAGLRAYVYAAINQIFPPGKPAKAVATPTLPGLAKEAMATLDEKEREALARFYGQEHPCTRICTELGLTEEYFSTLRSRVKAKIVRDSRGQFDALRGIA